MLGTVRSLGCAHPTPLLAISPQPPSSQLQFFVCIYKHSKCVHKAIERAPLIGLGPPVLTVVCVTWKRRAPAASTMTSTTSASLRLDATLQAHHPRGGQRWRPVRFATYNTQHCQPRCNTVDVNTAACGTSRSNPAKTLVNTLHKPFTSPKIAGREGGRATLTS